MLVILTLLAGCGGGVVALDGAPVESRSPAAAPTGTADWYVDCNGGGDFTSISSAISNATDGDWILVEDCEYTERLNYGGKSLWISSRNGPGSTTLNATSSGYAIQVTNGEGAETGFVGFSVVNARNAAVYADLASIHIEDVEITDTTGSYVVYGVGADLELVNVSITNNAETSAAIYTSRGGLELNRSTVECGRGSYGLYSGHGSAQIDWTDIDCGRNYAAWFENSTGHLMRSNIGGNVSVMNEEDHTTDSVDLFNCTLDGNYQAENGNFSIVNSVVDGGTIHYTLNEEYPGENEIVNTVLMNSTCAINVSLSTLSVRNNAFWDTTDTCTGEVLVGTDGNVGADPEFVDAGAGDYHLAAGSPLVDAGDDSEFGGDVDGSTADIGIYGGPFSQDGGW